ncbi:MAG: anhydro-N-acetylmuramic acid kinase [Xanthomonadaceae bacterium]|nr:anhydro-N-acetylmuramic acid kinase [Xanthomonadaceae bacterium]
MTALFAGLISGTSADGIDAALVEFDDHGHPSLLTSITHPYPAPLRAHLERAVRAQAFPLAELAVLDAAIADAFGDAADALLTAAGVEAAAVSALGSHGQTLGHYPGGVHGNTLQVGDPNRIAARSGIPVVADFRRADMAVGGQGAPLAPLFHAMVFGSESERRAVLNLGGIANLTILDPGCDISGFDVGPANTLLDGWADRHGHGRYDTGGAFAATGTVDRVLLEELLREPFLAAAPPKSTGREYFNLGWLDVRLGVQHRDPADVQATLAEYTVTTIADALKAYGTGVARVYVCGGGVGNTDLIRRLEARLPMPLASTTELGVDPDFVEAMLFAWLARERINAHSPAGLANVTGAQARAVLGGVWLPPRKL